MFHRKPASPSAPETPASTPDDRKPATPFPPMRLIREGFFRTTERPVTIEELNELSRKLEARNRSWF